GRGVDEASLPVDDRDLAPLERRLEALRQLVDDLLLAGLADGEVERRLAAVDPELLGPGDGAQHLGGLEQRLGRDAALVQTGPADLLVLDERDPEARGRAVQRRPLPTRPTPPHHAAA